MHAYRTHKCAELRAAHVGQTVRLSGWIHRKREHANVLFVDLRDHYGLTQIIAPAGSDVFKALDEARAESVVTVEGAVVARDAATINPNLATGEIEVHAKSVTVQSSAQELPMPVFGDTEYPEDIRLKYRYPRSAARAVAREHRAALQCYFVSIRRRMIDQGFTEFQTPILTASVPKARAIIWCPAACIPANSTRFRKRRRCSNSF